MDRETIVRELSLIAVVAFLLLAALFAFLPLDQTISTDTQRLAHPALTTLLRWVSVFGNGIIDVTLVAAAVALLAWRQRRLEAWFLLVVTASAGALGTAIRVLLQRQRPIAIPADQWWRFFTRYSFPSGHAVFYTAFFGALAFLLWKRFTGRARWLGIAVCLALIILVGPSRVYLGAHWPSDVVGGYLVSGLCLSAAILFYQWRHQW